MVSIMIDKEKFSQVVLYILNKINGSQLGSVKLNKILWFADVKMVELGKEQITGDTYIRKDYGPVSKHLNYILRTLASERSIIIERENPDSMWLYTPLKDADINAIKEDEKSIIDKYIEDFRCMAPSDISNMTHTPYWQNLNNNDKMFVEIAAIERMKNNNIDNINWE